MVCNPSIVNIVYKQNIIDKNNIGCLKDDFFLGL